MMCRSVARTPFGGSVPTTARQKCGLGVTTEHGVRPSSKTRPSPSTSARKGLEGPDPLGDVARGQVPFERTEESRPDVEREWPHLAAEGDRDVPVRQRSGLLHRALTELGGLVAAQFSEESLSNGPGAQNISLHAADEPSSNTNPISAPLAFAHRPKVSSARVVDRADREPQRVGRSRHVGSAPRATGSSGPLDVISQSIARAPIDAVTSPYVASVRS
jgi:hypothetical protein